MMREAMDVSVILSKDSLFILISLLIRQVGCENTDTYSIRLEKSSVIF